MRNLDTIGIEGYYLDTASSTTEPNTGFDYTFSDCTKIYWYANYNPAYVKADIYIDGVLFQTLDCGALGYATTPQVVWESPELERGTHTLRVVRCDTAENAGKWFEVDRLEAVCYGGALESAVLNDTAPSYYNYVSGFYLEEDQEALGSTLHTADAADSWMMVSFRGDFVELYGRTCPEGGIAEVYINGERKAVIDSKSAEIQNRSLLCRIDGLQDGMHTLKIKVVSGVFAVDYAVTRHPDNAATEIFRLGKEALAAMKDGTKTYIPEDQWRPVDKAADFPKSGVSLRSGIYYDAFMKNVKMIKKSIGLTHYVNYDSVWIENFPSANEGRILAAAGNSLRFMQDEKLSEAVKKLLSTAMERRKESGYCLPEPEEWYDGLFLTSDNPYVSVDECKNYGRVMYTQGLVAAGLAGYEDAYVLLRGLYDWLNGCDYKEYLLPGSLGIQGILGGTLCYESGVGRAQDIITNMLYYEMDWYLDYLGDAMPEAMYMYPLDRPHAYMATAACAFLDMYGATGEETYLQAALGAWTIFAEYYVTTGGGVCMCEGAEYKPGNHMLSHSSRSVYETCNNVLWADLNHRLLQYFPEDERFAHYLEQSLINIVFASQNAEGEIRYFNHMTQTKEQGSLINTCCEVQASRQLAQLPQFVYSYNEKGLYVNLYADSCFDFETESASGTLEMATEFPYGQEVALTLNMERSGSVILHVRIPSWAAKTVDVRLNGEIVASGTPGSYAAIERTFEDQDVITFSLPMEMQAVKYIGNSQIEGCVRYGILYGPVFMALCGPSDQACVQPGGEAVASLEMTPSELISRLRQADGKDTLTFSVQGEARYQLKPYISVRDAEEFACFPVLLEEGALVVGDPGQAVVPPSSATQEPEATATATAAVTVENKGGGELWLIGATAAMLVVAIAVICLCSRKRQRK